MALQEKKSIGLLIVCVACILFLSYLSSLTMQSSLTGWYQTLTKPPLTPKDGTFSVVWTVLYVLMGLSLWQLLLARKVRKMPRGPLALFFVQLALNLLWTPVFFGMQSPIGGLLVILPLWVCIVLTISTSYKYAKAAAVLLVPYLLWVTFAVYLTVGYVVYN